ncbi:Thioredoxin-like protein [Apiospora rasikravindrae]|uniref:Thioredoxin-like protein n=1 Tax=Apiospora rasikravindrae TaxID=990691 RepID=A0ABR1UBX5_9PEZI
MAAEDLPIVLYHYVQSPYARRVIWYLNLRKIPYTECLQPPIMPRPDVAQLGVAYRRIPLLAIGRDVYLDTRLILQKLEALFPASEAHPSLSAAASNAEGRALQSGLLSAWTNDAGGLFWNGVSLMPAELPGTNDPKFLADRAEMMGLPRDGPSPISKEARAARRPQALCEIAEAMHLLESTLLAGSDSDGNSKNWLLGTERPTLADIEAVFVFVWLASMSALPKDTMGPEAFPRLYAWMARFTKTVEAAEKENGAPKSAGGDEAAKAIFGSAFAEAEGSVDGSNPIVVAEGLKKGDRVKVWPTDSGFGHKESGKLVSMSLKEIVVEVQGKEDSVRVHAPRHGFKVKKDVETSSNI